MKNFFYLLFLLWLQGPLWAQPYLDVAGIRYQHSPDAGVARRGFERNKLQYRHASLNLPLVFRDSSMLLISPAVESWAIRSKALPQLPETLKGLALPVAFVKPLKGNWAATFLAVARWNGAEHFSFEDRMQLGGAVILAHKRNENLTYKFGAYYNREFFGHFVMPLLGIDWRINPRLRLFGVLPGNAVLEQKATARFYYGLSFRAVTTSYRYKTAMVNKPSFIRIEDNGLQAFADAYLTKRIVLNAEAGHSFFRRFRLGQEKLAQKYFMQAKFNDNLHFRLSLLYRMRFDVAK